MVRFADWVMNGGPGRDHHACQSPDAQDRHCWWRSDCPHDACCTSMGCAGTAGADHPTGWYMTVTGIPEQGGIVYGVNGVCHQIANRILYPSAQIVSHARGYWLSVSIFGTYGTNVAPSGWLLSSAIASAVAASAAIDWQSRMFAHQRHDDATGIADGGRQREIDYIRRVRSLYAEARPGPPTDGSAAHTDLHTRELDLMFEYRLGSSISNHRLRALRDQHHEYLLQKPARSPWDSQGGGGGGEGEGGGVRRPAGRGYDQQALPQVHDRRRSVTRGRAVRAAVRHSPGPQSRARQLPYLGPG